MDDTGVLDQVVIDGLFENGFMGVEIPEEHGGTGANFTSSCLGACVHLDATHLVFKCDRL